MGDISSRPIHADRSPSRGFSANLLLVLKSCSCSEWGLWALTFGQNFSNRICWHEILSHNSSDLSYRARCIPVSYSYAKSLTCVFHQALVARDARAGCLIAMCRSPYLECHTYGTIPVNFNLGEHMNTYLAYLKCYSGFGNYQKLFCQC
jgi:hypothetical protein